MLTLLLGRIRTRTRTRTRSILFDASTTKLPLLLLQIKTYSSLESKPFSARRRVNSERVISLLKDKGFTQNHITKLTNCPKLLFAKPQKTLAPKIDFLRSTGFSDTDLAEILVSHPWILKSSLKDRLIPLIHYLRSLLLSDENVVSVIKKCPVICYCGIEKGIAPSISLLSELGVTESRIQFMLLRFPNKLLQCHTDFKSKVEEAIRLGFDPTSTKFAYAIYALCSLTKASFERKLAAYKKWNLSDDDIQMAFRSDPTCMRLSEEKITRGMDFLVNRMGFEAVKIAASPVVLFFSLENRIIPRCRVIQVLKSKGVLKEVTVTSMLVPPETKFLSMYVTKYQDQLPDLSDIYSGKKECSETKIEFDA